MSKELSEKEINKLLTDRFINEQFNSYLTLHPGKRTEAALYAMGRLQAILLETMPELPRYIYKDVVGILKG